MKHPVKRREQGRRSFEFAWPVEQEHRWIEAAPFDLQTGVVGSKGKYLIGTGAASIYKPLESASGLFKNFVRVEAKPTALQAFTDKYGMLGIGETVVLRKGAPVIFDAESYDSWTEEMASLRRAVQLWDAINSYQSGQQRDLRKLIEWSDRTSVKYHWQGHLEWIATLKIHPELLERVKYPDLVQPALHFLKRTVDGKLKQFPSGPQLLWDRGELHVFIRPQSLIAGMWLQFALAIEGDRQYRTCKGCGRWFEVGGGQKRSDAETCGPSCRKRRERTRKEVKR